MNFVMFEFIAKHGYKELYACLIENNGIELINNAISGEITSADLENELVENIVASIILRQPLHACNKAYEMTNWAGSKKNAGKLLLMRVFDQGITLIADRHVVSDQAREAVLKLATSPMGKSLEFKPLDNINLPVTTPVEDDCITYTETGGYAKDNQSGKWTSKIKLLSPNALVMDDYLDFAVSMPNPKNTMPTIGQNDIDKLPVEVLSVLTKSVLTHFMNRYRDTVGGTRRAPAKRPPPPRRPKPNVPPPPRRKNQSITESLLRRLIKKSISDNLK